MSKKPNILLFFADDQRFDTIHALGNKEIITPNLDKLTETGVTFTHAHIPGGTCGAVCMPSRAMLNTGKTLFHLEDEGQNIPENHSLLGECLSEAGYTTFGTGKWHNGTASFNRSFQNGSEIFFGGMEDHWNVPASNYDPSGKYDNEAAFVRDPFISKKIGFRHCDHISPGVHSTDLFTDAAINFLDNKDTDKPFYMYVSLMAPHDPRVMPEKFMKMYDPEKITLPDNFAEKHLIDTGALNIRDELLEDFPRTPQKIKEHIAEYYAIITHLDDALGKLIQHLKDIGEYDNTIIIFSGDNGLAVGQHGLMGKQSNYEHSVRVPLIFSGPGIPVGEKRDAWAYLLDIFPTLCDLSNIDIPDSVEGKSLLQCIKNPATKNRESLYFVYSGSIRGVRVGNYKLIEYASGDSQLFNVAEDPAEIKNLFADSAMSETICELRKTMTQFRDDWDDTSHSTGKDFWKKRNDI